MKFCALVISFIMFTRIGISQTYSELLDKADSLYEAKDYRSSGIAYNEAFKASNGKGKPIDRYYAACSWALAGFPDSAFYYLNLVATESKYIAVEEFINDEDLLSLHTDNRWKQFIDNIKSNKEKAEAKLNKPLAEELEIVYFDDQKYRKMIDDYNQKYGSESKEMKDLWKIIIEKDSINQVKVISILDKYGWLGEEVVGEHGNNALFLVIQHANLKTQEHYLPMMLQAVKDGKAVASSLALLIDRIEMRNGRPQVYGSQITRENGNFVVYRIIDEVNVNNRRAEVGLEPLEKYVRHWNIDYKLPYK